MKQNATVEGTDLAVDMAIRKEHHGGDIAQERPLDSGLELQSAPYAICHQHKLEW